MTLSTRRIALACGGAVLAGLVVPGAAASATPTEQTADGVVYDDQNQNGRRDAGEPGVAGVAVSNGLDVVTTDADGAYELPVDDETIIFVTKPRGYMVPVNDVQLPQFYYLHYPNGTPHDLRYGGIEPTGPLPESVDFPLVRQEDNEKFDALVLADPQTYTSGEIEELRQDIVAELAGTDAAFGLTVGDVVNDPLHLFPEHNAAVAEIGSPGGTCPATTTWTTTHPATSTRPTPTSPSSGPRTTRSTTARSTSSRWTTSRRWVRGRPTAHT